MFPHEITKKNKKAKAIHVTVWLIAGAIRMMVVLITNIVCTTVMRIAAVIRMTKKIYSLV